MIDAGIDEGEATIRLENQLADELLTSPAGLRDRKYTEVYEKAYSDLSRATRHQMSQHYRSGAEGTAKAILKVIGNKNNVLDIGCGFGHLSHYMALSGNRVIGIDINRIHIKEAKTSYGFQKNLQFRATVGVRLDFNDALFDSVVSTSVYEHLHPKDVDLHLSEVYRVLKSKGGVYLYGPYTLSTLRCSHVQ